MEAAAAGKAEGVEQRGNGGLSLPSETLANSSSGCHIMSPSFPAHAPLQIAAHMFSAREFRTTILRSLILEGELLSKILSTAADSGESLDMFSLFNRFTLDTIGR